MCQFIRFVLLFSFFRYGFRDNFLVTLAFGDFEIQEKKILQVSDKIMRYQFC